MKASCLNVHVNRNTSTVCVLAHKAHNGQEFDLLRILIYIIENTKLGSESIRRGKKIILIIVLTFIERAHNNFEQWHDEIVALAYGLYLKKELVEYIVCDVEF